MAERSPSRFEFEFVAFLAESDPVTSREIYDRFGKPRGYTRGTVVKALDRLFKKGMIKREVGDGVFLYSAVPDKQRLEQSLVDNFVRERLGGKIAPLLSYFSESETVSDEELAELRELLAKLEDRPKGG